MFKLGFIDYYLDEWHANNYPEWIKEQSNGEMIVTHAFALIDSPKGGRTTDAWCSEMGITKCASIEDIIEQTDGLIVLSPDDAQMHEELCLLPLKSQKPVYIDKTFSPSLASGQRIFDNAEAHNTPCYSTSALRFATEYQDIDKSKIKSICAWGPGNFEIYSIHQLEPLMMLMGVEAKRVMAQEADNFYRLIVEFVDGRTASVAGFMDGSPFMMNLCMEKENKIVEVKSAFFNTFIERMVQFFKDNIPQVPHTETLRIMALREAGLKALKAPNTFVDVEHVE